jgi:hypothetical protein
MRQPTKGAQRRIRCGSTATAGVTALVLALSACGGSSSPPGIATAQNGPTASANPSASGAAGRGSPLKFAQCMRQHGVQMEDPDSSGRITIKANSGTQGTIDAAQKACRQFEPGGGKGAGKGMSKQDQAKFLKFAQCMRQHGVQMADPDFSGGGVKTRIQGNRGDVVDKAKIDAAQKACSSVLPKGMQGGGPA